MAGSRHPCHQGPITAQEKVLTGAGKAEFPSGFEFGVSDEGGARTMEIGPLRNQIKFDFLAHLVSREVPRQGEI